MDFLGWSKVVIPVVFGLGVLASSIRVIYQFERGVKFTLGRYVGRMEPGLRLLVPLFQSIIKVDIRQNTIDLKPQMVITKDQVSLKIDGVVFYVIDSPEKAVLNVTNLRRQIEDKTTSELKDIMGDMTMTEGLSGREKIAADLIKRLNIAISDSNEKDEKKRKDWGITIKAVQINNIELPPELVRAMAKKAEAEREADARKTKATGEKMAAEEFKSASLIYANNPEALKLRQLQTFQEIGTEQNSMMIVIPTDMMSTGNSTWPIPLGVDMLKKQEDGAKKTDKK